MRGSNNEKDVVGNGEKPLYSIVVEDSSILLVLDLACFKEVSIASSNGGGPFSANGNRQDGEGKEYMQRR